MSKAIATTPLSGQYPELKWLEGAADLLDDRFRLPGTSIRFGLDALIGLIPYLGDVVSFVLSGFLLMVMARRGASGALLVKMVGNILVDGAIGTIPFLGDLFDLRFRANKKNIHLLLEHYQEGQHGGSAWPLILMILLALVSLLVLSVVVISKLFSMLGMVLFQSM